MNRPMMMAKLPGVLLHAAPIDAPTKARLAHDWLGATTTQLAQPDWRVEVTAFYDLLEALDARLRREHPWWFLAIASNWKIDDFDVLGYLLYTSHDVRQSLERFMRYKRLWSEGEDLWLEEDDEEATGLARLCWRASGAHRRAHEILALMTAADCVLGTNALLREGSALTLHTIHLCTSRPEDPSPLQEIFGHEVALLFGSTHLIITLERASLDLPIASADELLHTYFEQVASHKLDALPEHGVTATLRHLLFRQLPGGTRPQIMHYSALLGMSERSLQRALRQEETSFTRLVEEVQEELAKSYLERGHSIQECCWMLSFSEPRAFHRAFKRWTGVTPTQWRAQAAKRHDASPYLFEQAVKVKTPHDTKELAGLERDDSTVITK